MTSDPPARLRSLRSRGREGTLNIRPVVFKIRCQSFLAVSRYRRSLRSKGHLDRSAKVVKAQAYATTGCRGHAFCPQSPELVKHPGVCRLSFISHRLLTYASGLVELLFMPKHNEKMTDAGAQGCATKAVKPGAQLPDRPPKHRSARWYRQGSSILTAQQGHQLLGTPFHVGLAPNSLEAVVFAA